MKKNILLVLFIFSISSAFSQIKSGQIKYQASIDTTEIFKKVRENNKKRKKNKFDKNFNYLDRLIKGSTPINFYLVFNEKECNFYYTELDNELKNEGKKKPNFVKIQTDSKSLYYANNETKEIYKQSLLFDKIIIVMDKVDWKLTTETKKIGNYTCYKALATKIDEGRTGIIKRPIVAWYTPEIPVSFGIQDFQGLPGLTLELSVGETFYKATEINLNPKKEVRIKKLKGKKVPYKKYNRALKSSRN